MSLLLSPNILVLSIRSEYAKKIFDGKKEVELRRTRPRYLREGDLVLVYVPFPEKALVGVFEVEKIVEEHPNKLWNIVKEKAGLSRKDFKNYYRDASVGFGIFLKNTCYFGQPVKLERLRAEWSDFRPPQCYRYVKPTEIDLVESLTHHNLVSVSDKPKSYQLTLL
ncbi:MAG: ASCH domain-containing protein [Coleofasciculus sp. G3-WIS-01]|uniref:ASCH domain-containing protein n=1 Tax=Coleofasciculus sp. G3-WIS-01 TaxID=3069528 RepID=UPI0032FAD8D6